jgi:ubiquitin fusion degradation protein 1
MKQFQVNIDEPWKLADKVIKVTIKVQPLVYFYNYNKFKLYEFSNKCIAPKSLLCELSEYNNLIFPIHLKYGKETLSIHEFIDDIDCLYIPNAVYKDSVSEEPRELEIVNSRIEKATKLIMKPFSSTFLTIENPKQYLEIHLKRSYSVLRRDQIISLIYKDYSIDFRIVLTEPATLVSLIDTEIEVDFEEPYDSFN